MDREAILDKIKELQPSYLPGWNPGTQDSGWAVAEVFANMMGELYEQFDKVPDKLFIAYLDKLGYTQNPPLPATVPVTFTLSDNCKRGVVVPSLSELESKSKVSFETTESITATPAKLTAMVDIDQNRYVTDHSAALDGSATMPLFSTTTSDNYLYFGDDHLFNIHKNVNTAVGLTLSVPQIGDGVWQYYGYKDSKSEEAEWITFKHESATQLDKMSPYRSAKTTINGVESYWIRVKTDQEFSSDTMSMNFKSRSNVDALFHNAAPIDQSRVFYPFGYQPQINDLFYIASGEAFSKKGFSVEVLFSKTSGEGNSHLSDSCFAWEYWNGESWKSLSSNPFTVPDDMSATTVNGEENYWVRVRVVNNADFFTYSDGLYSYNDKPKVGTLTINVKEKSGGVEPQYRYHYHNLAFQAIGTDVSEEGEEEPALYLGFDAPFEEGFISLYTKIAEGSGTEQRSITWQYYQDGSWFNLSVKDGSNAFAQSGYIQFIAPSNQTAVQIFSQTCYWIRGVFDASVQGRVVEALYLNTVEARASKTLDATPLGSSDGSGYQSFSLTDSNVFDFNLWVLESALPEGCDGYEDRFGEGYWVLWRAVEQLHHAGGSERVYVLNASLGEITFGDDRNGKIPPMGRDNILVSYALGGGTEGNVSAQEIDSMVDTVAYIDSVINHFDATGGADIQSIDKVMEIAPKRFKHRFRAVTHEDYFYLVQEASSDVAKVSVVESNGGVALYIISYGLQTMPTPSSGLKRVISEYIGARLPATISISVEAPQYIAVSLQLRIALSGWEYATTMKDTITTTLDGFLHPITGGDDGAGWKFGAVPPLADIYKLLNGIEGVETISSLSVALSNGKSYSMESQTVPTLGKDVMICSGTHTVDVVYEGGEKWG
jgi:hypothetical protein